MRSLEQILRGAIALKASDILFSAGVPVVLCSDYLSSFGDGSILTERHDVADRIRQASGPQGRNSSAGAGSGVKNFGAPVELAYQWRSQF